MDPSGKPPQVVCCNFDLDPGYLDSQNVKIAQKIWVPDHILYDAKFCSTCLIDRPARSKHCSVCKRCIAKLDHHCVWINNCVGYLNHRWFLLFLIATMIYCYYGTYLIFQVWRSIYEEKSFANLYFIDPYSNTKHKLTFWQSVIYILRHKPGLGALAIFAPIAGTIVLLFFQYQLWLILSGTTSIYLFDV
jgi:palmitoyltransferase